jgi:hypothetical protein
MIVVSIAVELKVLHIPDARCAMIPLSQDAVGPSDCTRLEGSKQDLPWAQK